MIYSFNEIKSTFIDKFKKGDSIVLLTYNPPMNQQDTAKAMEMIQKAIRNDVDIVCYNVTNYDSWAIGKLILHRRWSAIIVVKSKEEIYADHARRDVPADGG